MGTLSSRDQSQIGLCDHCGEEDALEHRALRCSRFAAARKDFQALIHDGIGVCWRYRSVSKCRLSFTFSYSLFRGVSSG